MAELNVVHSFFYYLQRTENWAFRLISNIPEVNNYIVSKHFHKNNFYPAHFKYVEFPVKEMESIDGRKSVYVKAFNKMLNKLVFKLYPSYVQAMLKSVKIDLLHSHFGVVGWEYLSLAKKLKCPHIVSFYGLDYEYLPFCDPRWHNRYKDMFREAQMFLCEGKFGVQKLVSMGCPENKIRVARLGVEIEKIPCTERTKAPDELKLLQIANFRKKKGHVYSVKAFIEALKTAPNMHLTIVGKEVDAGIESEMRKLIVENRIEDKVTLLGFVDFSKLYEFMGGFHVFIHPSCYTEERDCEGGAPVVLLDAQAAGMPVISTTHCDIPEEVLHEKTGLLSPEKDVKGISENIVRFYKMGAAEYKVFCAAARKHVEDNYDIARNGQLLRGLYEEAIAGKAR